MSTEAFYRLTEPSAWRTTIDKLSYSSLKAIEQCPRQWQLLHSQWPGFGSFPQRRHRATVEGTLVHAMLDRIFRAMALRGLPKPGSAAFRAVLAELDVFGTLRREIDAWNAEIATHPRAVVLRIQTTERALYNKVAELFQAEYASVEPGIAHPTEAVRDSGVDDSPLALLERRGVLTEWNVEHPTLPVRGQIDLVRRDACGTHIVDFKTGAPKPEYRDQLALYALLWWRATRDLPVTTELRHPRGLVEFPVDRAALEGMEGQLSERIAAVRAALVTTPARASRGEHCRLCDARPFCDAYWAGIPKGKASRHKGEGEFADVEVTVVGPVAANGFEGITRGGARLPVVYDEEGAAQHGPFEAGERLRLLGALWIAGETELRMTRTTEVFRSAGSFADDAEH